MRTPVGRSKLRRETVRVMREKNAKEGGRKEERSKRERERGMIVETDRGQSGVIDGGREREMGEGIEKKLKSKNEMKRMK